MRRVEIVEAGRTTTGRSDRSRIWGFVARLRQLGAGFMLVAASLKSTISNLCFQAGTLREGWQLCRRIEKVQVDAMVEE